jgi:hypothetical protein
LGDAGLLPLSDARELAQETLLKVIRGGDPAADKKAKRDALTFGQLVARYQTEYASKKNKAWKQPAYLLRRFVLPQWKDLPAEGLKRSDMRALLAKIEGPSLGNQILVAVSAAYSWGSKVEVVTNNPARGVERHVEVARERILSDSELPLF